MALSITHSFVSSKTDGSDPTQVRPSNWNAVHVVTGTINETYLAFTDVTTANVSTSMHGLAPKSPGDAALYLDGSGAYSNPPGGGASLSTDNTWTGTNLFSNQLQVGGVPDCDFAQLTVYFTMTPDTNSSMVDIIGTSNGVDETVAMNVIMYGEGTISDYINGIYVRTDVQSGATNEATAIWIDTPTVDSGTLGVAFGLYVSDFSLSSAGSSANIYSVGRKSQNYFEGIITQSPFNQLQSGTFSDGGSDSTGNSIVGAGTFFTQHACVGDLLSNGSGVGQIITITDDTHMLVWPPGAFTGVSGASTNIYPATIRLVDQLTSQGMWFAFNQSAMVISGFSGLNSSPCNFVLGSPTNMINGETQFSLVLGGNNNTVSSSQSVIVGGINNVITGNQSVVLSGDAMTVSGNEVVAMGLGSTSRTVSQNNCFVVMDGNVGFGTVAPAFALEVVGDVHVSDAPLHIDDSQWIDFRDTDTNWRLGYMPSGGGGAFTMTNISTAMQQVIGSGDTDGWAVGQTGGNSILELKGSDQSAWFLGNINVAGNLMADSVITNIVDEHTAITQVGSVSVGSSGAGEPAQVFVLGNYAYVTDQGDGTLAAVDITVPSNPVQLSTVSVGSEPFGVYVFGNYAYVSNYIGESLSIVDVSNPLSMSVLSTFSIGQHLNYIFVSGHFAYITDANGDLNIIDVSDPSNPISLYSSNIGQGAQTQGIAIVNEYAFVACQSAGVIAVVDISNPSAASVVTTVVVNNLPTGLYVSGNYLYVVNLTGAILSIVDISNPTSLSVPATVGVGVNPRSVFVSGRYAYVTNNSDNTFSILDVSNPASPTNVGTISTGNGPTGICVSGRYAYVTNQSSNNLMVFDLCGLEAITVTAHGAKIGNLQVINDIHAGGELQVGRSLSVGDGGIVSSGDIVVIGNESISGILSVETIGGDLSVTGSLSATTMAGGYQNWGSGDSTLNFDLSKGNVQTLTLTVNTSPTFTNIVGGQDLTLILTQDSTGGRTVTWPSSVNDRGNLEVNLQPNAVTTLNFTSGDGSTLTPLTQFGAMAFSGNPNGSYATGNWSAGSGTVTFTQTAVGPAYVVIVFDTNAQYGSTVIYGYSGGNINVGLRNTGGGSLCTGNELIAAWRSGIDEAGLADAAAAIALTSGDGTGFIGTGTLTLTGGADQFFTPEGGELWVDSDNLYIGQTNGTFCSLVYDQVNTVSFSTTPIFDCSKGNTQTITLMGSVTSSLAINIPTGKPITFVVIQDGGGGYTFVWPANIFGVMTIGSSGNAVSVQTFISVDGVNLYATGIGVVN